ncbi:Chitin synthase, class 3 [Terramyces sp. JEL0728]|nr:Chitin synthase, class 3 [Terramyces sp. JEL0728]
MGNALASLQPPINLTLDWYSEDIAALFSSTAACSEFIKDISTFCSVPDRIAGSPSLVSPKCDAAKALADLHPVETLFFSWSDVSGNNEPPHELIVYNGAVLNITRFLNSEAKAYFQNLPPLQNLIPGKDVTREMSASYANSQLMQCLLSRYTVGYLGSQSAGCAVYNAIMVIALVTILGVILARFVMAFVFHWFIAPQMAVHTTMKLGKNDAGYLHRPPNVPFYSIEGQKIFQGLQSGSKPLPTDLHTIVLVTCYSEDANGIRGTLDSIAATDYPEERKLLFVICDGLIQGEGNTLMTPDIVVSMIEQDPAMGDPEPKSYFAIAEGEKQHNMAKVYAGVYKYYDRAVPIVVVVKCGTDEERNVLDQADLAKRKAGNRGKRDSQLLLFNFLSRVTYNDRMTPLDFELFWKIHQLTQVTPDYYQLLLMIDADTIVSNTCITYMVQTMVNDPKVMGLCGETRIANKNESWVTMIQVYEYFTNHNLGKAFESVFGGVTCLPGCFCMYRIKVPKGDGFYTTLLVDPDIIENYSENIVDTLHKKNLLLLGEDRFLSTLMLSKFPKRRMVFVPQAICHTTVPHTYKMLQSQRRRWINSTIHNLLELVFVPGLCGTFCFSMQFVIALDLFGTVSLPAAIILTFYLIIDSIFSADPPVLPLVLLLITLILPGILVLLTTRKPVYTLWMFVYILALPIWNFALPLYAFWHFDDFSWGDTRKIEGEEPGGDHSVSSGIYQVGSVQPKTWEVWEAERRKRYFKGEIVQRPTVHLHPLPFIPADVIQSEMPISRVITPAESEYQSVVSSAVTTQVSQQQAAQSTWKFVPVQNNMGPVVLIPAIDKQANLTAITSQLSAEEPLGEEWNRKFPDNSVPRTSNVSSIERPVTAFKESERSTFIKKNQDSVDESSMAHSKLLKKGFTSMDRNPKHSTSNQYDSMPTGPPIPPKDFLSMGRIPRDHGNDDFSFTPSEARFKGRRVSMPVQIPPSQNLDYGIKNAYSKQTSKNLNQSILNVDRTMDQSFKSAINFSNMDASRSHAIDNSRVETSLNFQAGDTINKFWRSKFLEQQQGINTTNTQQEKVSRATLDDHILDELCDVDSSILPTSYISNELTNESLNGRNPIITPYAHPNEYFDPNVSTISSIDVSVLSSERSGASTPKLRNTLPREKNPTGNYRLDDSILDCSMESNDSSIFDSRRNSVADLPSLKHLENEISIISSTRSSVQGPRPIPSDWDNEFSFSSKDPKTSTTDKSFMEMFANKSESKKGTMTEQFKNAFRRESGTISKAFKKAFQKKQSLDRITNETFDRSLARVKGPREMKD